jgi:hypothetical protein
MFVEMMALSLSTVIQNYSDVFDCYFSVVDENPDTRRMFKSEDVHPYMPTLMIVDK